MTTVWEEWGSVTRFLESTRLAFAREQRLWDSLEIKDFNGVSVASSAGVRHYEVSLAAHIKTVSDETILLASVLIHTYALAESAACKHLAIDSRSAGGIEAWGGKLLTKAQRNWSGVFGGRAGIVEVGVVRNAFAHGTHAISKSDSQRLQDAGAAARAEGALVTLDYEQVKIFRDRLRSLLRHTGVDPTPPTLAVADGSH